MRNHTIDTMMLQSRTAFGDFFTPSSSCQREVHRDSRPGHSIRPRAKRSKSDLSELSRARLAFKVESMNNLFFPPPSASGPNNPNRSHGDTKSKKDTLGSQGEGGGQGGQGGQGAQGDQGGNGGPGQASGQGGQQG